jgi:hypothetical protein
VPLDSFGRNIYVDTFSSPYGAGWKRDNRFLTHNAKGSFCYGFFPSRLASRRQRRALPRNRARPGRRT